MEAACALLEGPLGHHHPPSIRLTAAEWFLLRCPAHPCSATAHMPYAPNLTALHLVLPPLPAPTQPASCPASIDPLFPLLLGRRVGCAMRLTLCPWPAAPVACALQPLLSEPCRMHSSGAQSSCPASIVWCGVPPPTLGFRQRLGVGEL